MSWPFILIHAVLLVSVVLPPIPLGGVAVDREGWW